MHVIVTAKFILGQIITFCVPLIIIGFIAPSITKLGNNASKILGVAILSAYTSSVFAALFSMGCLLYTSNAEKYYSFIGVICCNDWNCMFY